MSGKYEFLVCGGRKSAILLYLGLRKCHFCIWGLENAIFVSGISKIPYSTLPNNWGGLFFDGEIDTPQLLRPPNIRLPNFRESCSRSDVACLWCIVVYFAILIVNMYNRPKKIKEHELDD